AEATRSCATCCPSGGSGCPGPDVPVRGSVRPMADDDTLLAPMVGARHEEFAGIRADVVHAGEARVKRLVYPPGSRWSKDVKPHVGGDRCGHAHVGFLARGHLRGEYGDGCGFDFSAPAGVVIEPSHDMWVVGDEAAILIQFDFERDTLGKMGLSPEHGHT